MKHLDVDKAQKLIVSAVALFGVLTYFLNQHLARAAERKNLSLAYIAKYSEPPLLESRIELANFWIQHPAMEQLAQEPTLTSRERQNFFFFALKDYERQPKFLSSVAIVEGFFDELQFCLTSSTCEASIIKGYFCDDLANFNARHSSLFDLARGAMLTPNHEEAAPIFVAQCDGLLDEK